MIDITRRKKRARHYAIAFFKQANSTGLLEEQDIQNLLALYKQYPFFFILLAVSTISFSQKIEFLDAFWEKFSLNKNLKKVILVVLKRHDTRYIPDILHALLAEYKKRNNLLDVFISTSTPLDQTERNTIISSLEKILPFTIVPHFTVDKALIGGIKIRSEQYYWEQSIAKRLRLMEHKLSQPGSL